MVTTMRCSRSSWTGHRIYVGEFSEVDSLGLLVDVSRTLQNSTDSRDLRFSALPSQVRALWAKSGDDTFAPEGHGVLAHLLDVAAVAEVLVERETRTSLDWVAREFGLARGHCLRWLAARW